jgi:class 3 adenylate cyclase/tetratricopeptide (TPR) repeat protein
MPKTTRKIAAILAADVVGYSRLMGVDDEQTLASLKERREIFDRLVGEFDGREFGSVGDSLMAQFGSAVNAVRCAQEIQRTIARTNESVPADRRMSLRIGINLGDVIEEDGALFGDGVNVAARLQTLAEPGGILVSGSVHEQVRNKIEARIAFAGSRQVKNIAEPVKTYQVSEPAVRHLGQRVVGVLRRREVIVAAAYVVLSSLLVLAFGRIAPSAGAPAWMLPAMVTLLAAGFIVVIALGRRLDPHHPAPPWARVLAVTVTTILSGVVAGSAWRDYREERERASITRPAPKAQPVLAVGTLVNLTGDPKLDWLSEGLANLIRDGLAESRHLVVVSPRRWQAVLRNPSAGAAGSDGIFASAADAGIDYVISGEFLAGPEGFLLTSRLTDVQGGIELDANRSSPDLTQQALLREADRLVLMAKTALKIPHTEIVGSYSADFAVNNMAAYEAYVGGLGYLQEFDYRSADRAFRKALELAPEFHMARYRLAQVQVVSGDTEAALATLDRIPEDAPLSRRERSYVDGAQALFARDAGRAKTIYNATLEEFPFDVEARMMLAIAHDLAFEDESAIAELKRLLVQEPQNDHLWSYLGEDYLRLGEYDLAREALDRYLQLKPRDPFGFKILGDLEQLTGDPAAAVTHYTHALELEPGFVPARLAQAQAQVLLDNWGDAERQFRALVEGDDVPPVNRIDAAFDLSALLRAAGRFSDSLQPLEELEPQIRKESIREAMALAERGMAQAELGKFAQADALIERAIELERTPGPATRYMFARGRTLLIRGDFSGARAVAAEIRAQRMPAGDPQDSDLARQNAARAAAWVDAMADLVAGDARKAVGELEQVVAMPGYQYSIYKLGLAQALSAAGRNAEALVLARAAAAERDPGEIRLDLEPDRSRALLLEAEILAALGRKPAALARARDFLQRWTAADPGHRDLARAARIAS